MHNIAFRQCGKAIVVVYAKTDREKRTVLSKAN